MSTPLKWSFVVVAALTATAVASDNPIELGKVRWLREYEQAVAQANKTGRSILTLFQEVPG